MLQELGRRDTASVEDAGVRREHAVGVEPVPQRTLRLLDAELVVAVEHVQHRPSPPCSVDLELPAEKGGERRQHHDCGAGPEDGADEGGTGSAV